ncbi:hypothetical protein [Thalassotalea mangrovi]|uniref:PEP-CTERM sorting domain-containing protein n=1 Tax=Thalassotalea mangrovi TaxID=2572245 RepID=A0A4U1B2K8_9GAMM|nr:hypothetical protein [Thalassotalea mangrovi]TKB43965.1 hypothetical protein E8M12_13390 [Thalassotalea mangrovi]
MLSRKSSLLTNALAMCCLFLLSTPASAALITLYIDGYNDCAGYFGQGFDSCSIFAADAPEIEISSVIAKFGDGNETNASKYPSIDGSEFSFTPGTSGNWSYTPEGDDPGVRFWVAKAGNGFNLFWEVSDEDFNATDVCNMGTNANTYACMNAALTVTSGYWITPLNRGGQRADLSHLTFYNGEGDVPPQEVPETNSWLLLGVALLSLTVYSRRPCTTD